MERINLIYQNILQHAAVSDKTLSVCRIVLALFHINLIFPSFIWIGEVPQAFFNPPFFSLSSLLSNIPPRSFFVVLEVVLLTSLLFVLLGIHTRKFLILCFITGIIGSTFKYSFGKIDHDIFNWLFFLILYFTNAGSYLALRPDSIKPQSTVRKATAFLAFCLVFAYFTAGLLKAIHWIDFDLNTSGILHWFYAGYFLLNRDLLLAEWVFSFPPILLEILDYTAAIFEVSGLVFLLWSRKAWHWYLIFALLFHGSVILILNISFLSMLPVLLVFLFEPGVKFYNSLEKNYKLYLPVLAVLSLLIFIIIRLMLQPLIPYALLLGLGFLTIFTFFLYYLRKQITKKNH